MKSGAVGVMVLDEREEGPKCTTQEEGLRNKTHRLYLSSHTIRKIQQANKNTGGG